MSLLLAHGGLSPTEERAVVLILGGIALGLTVGFYALVRWLYRARQ